MDGETGLCSELSYDHALQLNVERIVFLESSRNDSVRRELEELARISLFVTYCAERVLIFRSLFDHLV